MNSNPFSNNAENGSLEENKIDQILRGLFIFLIIITGLIILAILICFTYWSTLANAVKVAASILSIGGAYLLGGAIVGFLFAIPRSGTFRYKPGQDNSKSWYDDNTNLEEISDWLTKIIVGVTLIQFNKILQLLDVSANTIATSISVNITLLEKVKVGSQFFFPWSYSLIVFFSACGFVIGYLWTRINFALILTISRKRLNDISNMEQQKQQLQEDVNNEKEVLGKVKDAVSAAASQDNIRKAETTSFIGEIKEDTDDNTKKLKQMIEASKSKPVVVPGDTQKGRWGGKDVRNGKKLSAVVTKSEKVNGYFDVSIRVSSMSDAILESPVAIFVHDSFNFTDNVILVDAKATKEARANLLSYEAFAVGALCLDGTELELDLNDVQGYPSDFYWK